MVAADQAEAARRRAEAFARRRALVHRNEIQSSIAHLCLVVLTIALYSLGLSAIRRKTGAQVRQELDSRAAERADPRTRRTRQEASLEKITNRRRSSTQAMRSAGR